MQRNELITLHFFYAPFVMPPSKWSLQEYINYLKSLSLSRITGRNTENIRIVMLTNKRSNFYLPGQSCPDSIIFVRGYSHAVRSTTEEDSVFRYSTDDILTHRMG